MSDWHQGIFATHEEAQELAIGPWLGNAFPGVALPCKRALFKWVIVRCKDLWTCARVVDVGPWCVDDSDYVFGIARPRAELLKGQEIFTTKDGQQHATVLGAEIPLSNGAGIDLFPATAIILEIQPNQNVNVDWKFIEPPF